MTWGVVLGVCGVVGGETGGEVGIDIGTVAPFELLVFVLVIIVGDESGANGDAIASIGEILLMLVAQRD